jgi:hypothetical protein
MSRTGRHEKEVRGDEVPLSGLRRPRARTDPPRLFCENREAGFPAANALVSFATLLDLAEQLSACSCDDAHGAPRCFRRAEEMIGATVRDFRGRTGEVTDVDEKDDLPTTVGRACGDRPAG